ncbi:MAG: glycosyltransferase, partial [Nocardioides sp.]
APDALERLLEAAADDPRADVLGPKLREWPSLKRLLEVGVTLTGTGRRETGLERGEYDQGQHDQAREVLAVNTAGMLVRRSVLASLGFDRRLPLFGNDLDFGWRAARAGHRTLVVPDAVLFHVEAAHRGVRKAPLTGRHFRRGEREAALYTLLVNGSAALLPVSVVRLLLGSLLRALGFLLVRSPGEALDELVAVARVYGRPWRVLSGRRRRRASARLAHRDVRHLLAPPWLPYRHGLDFVSDLATAVAHQAGDISAARRAARGGETETGPVPAEAQNLPADTGLLARALSSPVVGVFAVLVVAAFAAARGLVGSGVLSGGALLPAPGSALEWWRTYLASSHDLGTGSSAPAASYLLPLALVGTLLLGKAWVVVDLVFLFAVPVAAYGGFRFLRRVTGSRPAAMWGGAAYGLLPVLMGTVQQGRLGTVVAALVLPWLAHAALFLAPTETQDRRVRAAWRTALWLALLAAFAPLGLVLAAALTLVVLLTGLATDRGRWVRREVWWPVLVPVVVAFVLLLPWSVAVWGERGLGAWLFEAGLPAPGWTRALGRLDVLFGRPAKQGAPWWLGLGVLLAALAALLRTDTRPRVLRAWVVVVLGLVAASVLSGVAVTPATSQVSQPVWLGLPLLLAQAAAVTAAAIAGAGVRALLTGVSCGWRQPVGAALVVLALLAPVAGLAWWVATGSGGPLDRRSAVTVPPYMSE